MSLTNGDLLSFNTKREQLNNNTYLLHNNNNNNNQNENNNNSLMPQLHLLNSYNENATTDSFQNREVDSDEEELNDVLNDLDPEPVIKQESEVGSAKDDNDLTHEESSIDSLLNVETTNTLNAMIEATSRLTNHTNEALQSHNQNRMLMYQPRSIVRQLPTVDNFNNNSSEKKSIYFVTSKVGHPMLVVDQYTFHKHSTNPKTNRINWRCSRRRVKEIRCSSSCYTIDGVVSNPTPHDVKCYPLSEALLTNYQNKRAKITYNGCGGLINMKADSFTTLKNKEASSSTTTTVDENNASNEFNNNDEYSNDDLPMDDDPEEDDPYKNRPRLQLLESGFRNKRKENMPTRSNESSEEVNCEEFNDGDGVGVGNLNLVAEGDGEQLQDVDELFYENDGDYQSSENNGNDGESVYYDDSVEEECDMTNSSNVLSQLVDLKRKYRESTAKLRSANSEVDRLKRTSSLQIQSYVWKSKIMEMDMSSLKSIVHQKNVENSNLKKLVDDMISKLKSD